MFGSMCVHGCETECAACSYDGKRKRDSGERDGEWKFVTSKISEEQSQPLPTEAIHEPIYWLCVHVLACALTDTTVPIGLYEHV